MNNKILNKILEEKINSLKYKKNILPKEKLIKKIEKTHYLHRNFKNSILNRKNKIAIIAECKKSSPVDGVIRENYDISKIVKEYFDVGVEAISIITEEKFFNGDINDLLLARNLVSLPLLRKDFIIEDYQIFESLYYGADAILLIVSLLDDNKLKYFYELSKQLQLEVLFEIHKKQDLERILGLEPQIIGINNRNLENFKVDIKNTEKIIKFIPRKDIVLVSESGINSNNHLKYLYELGVDAVLIGSYFMRSDNIKNFFKKLMLNL